MSSRSFGGRKPQRPSLVDGKRGVAGEVNDLRKDTEAAFTSVEGEIDLFGVEDISVFMSDGTWTKPANVNMIWMLVVTAGGGGGAGFSGAPGTGRGGGGGGSSGGSVVYTLPARLMPATLDVEIGLGASGTPQGGSPVDGGSTRLVGPDGTVWGHYRGGKSANPAVATGLNNAANGQAALLRGTLGFEWPVRLFSRGGESAFYEFGGSPGAPGARGLVGTMTEENRAITADIVSGGAGGAGLRAEDVAGWTGGAIGPAPGYAPLSTVTIAGGVPEGGNGQNGTTAFDLTTLTSIAQLTSWWGRGGGGGASHPTGQGGNGGDGAPGCGGGGGGAGVTGGLGGRGGDGFVIICSWR